MLRRHTQNRDGQGGRAIASVIFAAVVVTGMAACADNGNDAGDPGVGRGDGGGGYGPPAAGVPDPGTVDLASVTLTLPQWPAADRRSECPSGTYTFVDGQAPAARGWNYYIEFLGDPVHGDLDGRPGEEILTVIGCGPPESEASTAAVGLWVTDIGRVETMGYVQGDASFVADIGDIGIEDRIVLLDTRVGLGPDASRQHREFRWEDRHFVQVSGPTEVP
ncbi:hypothetical protein IU501_17085 [Nocardia otitidiscaviarum]|uniref:hypothetical protein n=1 Tax=Nocardia otitidiscaviarum TaxID=1823 RepID=UPI0011DD9661|nr:hypothetical protein [Nocardia otitidiscaviarum]MBF6134712.1 hypothetical protein [Nocardia otitidiscaviarum]MBF6485662.1 hypothetical protein [Nocardia otitidiscaviarum]